MNPRTFFIVIIGIFTVASCSQNIPEAEIPSVVLNTLKKEFNQATDVEWEKNGSIYEAEFEIGNVEHDILIEETGKLIRYKKELLVEDLPGTLRDTLSIKFKDFNLDDVHLLVVGEKSYYQVEFNGRLTDSKKVFNNLGEEIQDINYYDEI